MYLSKEISSKEEEENSVAVSFSRRDLNDALAHENDSIVIKVQIHDLSVKWVLIDLDNYVDVLY